MLYAHDYGSEEMRDLRAADFRPTPEFQVIYVATPPGTDALYVATTYPEVWAALRAEEQRLSERIAAAAGGWTEGAIRYRLPTDVLDLVDAVALCQEQGYEVVTKGVPGDPTLIRVMTRPLVPNDAEATR